MMKDFGSSAFGHIRKDQNPGFFVGEGVISGISRTFVENIREWIETVKKVMPILDDA